MAGCPKTKRKLCSESTKNPALSFAKELKLTEAKTLRRYVVQSHSFKLLLVMRITELAMTMTEFTISLQFHQKLATQRAVKF